MARRIRKTARCTPEGARGAAKNSLAVADLPAQRGKSATLPNTAPSRKGEGGRPGNAAQEQHQGAAKRDATGARREGAEPFEEARQRALDELCAQFELTDLGNVDRFAARSEGRFLYNGEAGWLRCVGEYWKPAGKEHVLRATHECVRAIQFEADWIVASGHDYVLRTQYKGSRHERPVFRSEELRSWGRACEQLHKIAALQPHIAAKMNVDDLSNITLKIPRADELRDRHASPFDATLRRFLFEHTNSSTNGKVQASILFDCFSAWCGRNDQRKCTPAMFGRVMRSIGYESRHSNCNWWMGIELIDTAADSSKAGDGIHKSMTPDIRDDGRLQ